MARKPLALPKAIDKYDDAVRRLEKAVEGVEKSLSDLDFAMKHTKPVDAYPFASDIGAIALRLTIVKGKF